MNIILKPFTFASFKGLFKAIMLKAYLVLCRGLILFSWVLLVKN